jgi:ubiquinone/menaquinone biosynthesis C-methylase UbiE
MSLQGGEEFVPAAGSAAFTGAYDVIIALTDRVQKLRGGMVSAVKQATYGIAEPRILEIGCGTGSLSIALATGITRAQVTGVDIDPEALAIAKAKPHAYRVKWLKGNATDLPLDAGNWDAVVISLVLHHLTPEQQPVALAAARAALRPGGSLHVVDFAVPQGALPKLGWPLLQRIDGKRNTDPLGNGQLPTMIDAAGFAGRSLIARYGTVWGTHEQYAARLS